MIQIIHGSIFDAKCDLLIIPCDSAGGVTQSVFGNLKARKIPLNLGRIPYGRVLFNEYNYEFANTIGFAASVDVKTITSESSKITEIAEEIVKYARDNSLRIVNVPLLGSGAGGMTSIDSFESLKIVFQKEDDITFNIFCFTRESQRNVLNVFRKTQVEEKTKSPRVFVSYASNDKENASFVKKLATKLRENGIDARLDAFHLKAGFDLPQWMTNEVILADKVLLICDTYYMEKADFRKGGVGWETMIIQGDMLAQGDNKQKYIALVLEDDIEKALPIYMKSKYAFNWGAKKEIDKEKFKELILCLFDCDSEPELGKVPDYVKNTSGNNK